LGCSTPLLAASNSLSNGNSKFLGAASCASSSCHGGGGQHQNQYLIWSLRDFHSQRPFATLTTSRARQIADSLHIADPISDLQCTSCHAPLHEVPSQLRGDAFKVSEGVSCETCHGRAEPWLRSHTRTDFTHADRVQAGMRDLKNLYARANSCVACHQTVAIPLLRAGHPELIFELDGQTVSEPKHWRESTNTNPAQLWLVGQATALREMSWQLSREQQPDEKLVTRWRALLWLLQKLDALQSGLPKLAQLSDQTSPTNLKVVWETADDLAKRTAASNWPPQTSTQALKTLAGCSADFEKTTLPAQLHARRAERLVLALDRLLLSAGTLAPAANQQLDQLFQLAQSIPDFDSAQFATALKQFSSSIN
jgi:hypothetical protein